MLIHTFVPVGTVLPYAGKLASGDDSADAIDQIKTNLGTAGWLYCDGSPMSCNYYTDLFGVIGYSFGGSGDSFNLPDLRGQFIRGVSETAAQDPDRGQRTSAAPGGNSGAMVGSVQQDAFQGHQHNYNAPKNETVLVVEEGTALTSDAETSAVTKGYVADPSGAAAPRTSTETRPVNLYLNYIIRFRAEPPLPY